MSAGSSAIFVFDGTRYQQIAGCVTSTTYLQTLTTNSTLSINGLLVAKIQSFSSAGTITTTGGPQVEKTASGAYTLALPTSPSTGTMFWLFDGFGDALTFNLSVSSSDKAINGTAAGGGAVTAVITNYGRATITFDGTAWKLAKG
jgi:hypothetical protein